jgi:hypothetical protein
MGGLILTEQGLTNHSPLQLVKQYQRVLERTRKVEIRELLKTDESKTLQKAMLLLIGAVEKVLPGLKQRTIHIESESDGQALHCSGWPIG